jgi:hypothetical protein
VFVLVFDRRLVLRVLETPLELRRQALAVVLVDVVEGGFPDEFPGLVPGDALYRGAYVLETTGFVEDARDGRRVFGERAEPSAFAFDGISRLLAGLSGLGGRSARVL